MRVDTHAAQLSRRHENPHSPLGATSHALPCGCRVITDSILEPVHAVSVTN